MLRDNQIYKPWYDGTVAAQRQTQGNFAADYLHDETAALMEGRASYHVFARAAAGFPAVASLSVSFAQVTKLPDDAFTSGFNMGDFL